MIEKILSTNESIYIYAKDKNLRYLFCNEALAEAAGVDSPKQLIGKTDYDVVWKKYAGIYHDGDRDILIGKKVQNKVEPLTQKDTIITILTSKTVLRNKNDDVSGIAGYSVDITGYSVMKKNGYIDPQKNIFFLGEHFGNTYFTNREFLIFKYLLAGESLASISIKLSRSVKTLETHVKNIVTKLQCRHKAEIVPTAIKYGLMHVI